MLTRTLFESRGFDAARRSHRVTAAVPAGCDVRGHLDHRGSPRPCGPAGAETDVMRQGRPVTVLAERGIDFGASRGSVVAAVAIAVCLAALATLNLAGNDTGRILTWILQPLLFVAGLVIMPGEVFTARYVNAAFRKAGVRDIEVHAFVDA